MINMIYKIKFIGEAKNHVNHVNHVKKKEKREQYNV
jgi:hypothetical protein